MKLKFYLEKLHKNEILEEDDIDYVKQYIKDNTKEKTFISVYKNIDDFLNQFSSDKLIKARDEIDRWKNKATFYLITEVFNQKLNKKELNAQYHFSIVGKMKEIKKNNFTMYAYPIISHVFK